MWTLRHWKNRKRNKVILKLYHIEHNKWPIQLTRADNISSTVSFEKHLLITSKLQPSMKVTEEWVGKANNMTTAKDSLSNTNFYNYWQLFLFSFPRKLCLRNNQAATFLLAFTTHKNNQAAADSLKLKSFLVLQHELCRMQ